MTKCTFCDGTGLTISKNLCNSCNGTGYYSTQNKDARGYHSVDIIRGHYGELTKIQEELDELKDAAHQGVKIMCLLELSDLIGAIEGYVEKYFPDTSLEDLIKMKDRTKAAFLSGKRA